MCGRFAFQGDQWPELQPISNSLSSNQITTSVLRTIHLSFITIRTTLPSPQCNGVFVLLGAKRVRWNQSMPESKQSIQSQCFEKHIVNDVVLFLQMDGTNGRQHREEKFHSITQPKQACLAHGRHLRTLGRRRTIVEHVHNTHSRINSGIQHIHNRMPVIIDEMEADSWLKDSHNHPRASPLKYILSIGSE